MCSLSHFYDDALAWSAHTFSYTNDESSLTMHPSKLVLLFYWLSALLAHFYSIGPTQP